MFDEVSCNVGTQIPDPLSMLDVGNVDAVASVVCESTDTDSQQRRELLRCHHRWRLELGRGHAVASSCSASQAITVERRQTRRRPILKLAGPSPVIAQYRHVEALVPVSASRSLLLR